MPVTVSEGPVAPAPPGSGVQLLAVGEFVGHHSELASYALGWTPETAFREARITVGIGRGNEGGGTFHVVLFVDEGGPGYQLVDEPLTEVPQGGPHLSADEARAHEDLPYIWHVVNSVLSLDRRGRQLWHRARGTITIVTGAVADGSEPVLLLCNDEDEEPPMWQAIGHTPADPASGRIIHLDHLFTDPTLADVLDLAPGEWAERTSPDAPWVRMSRTRSS